MLLRHAKSAWPDSVDDHERPLAKRGRRAAAVMGSYLARKGLLPDLAIVSTARRARDTWELARSAFASPPVRRDEQRIYEAPAHSLLEIIREADAEIRILLLVGHSPGLQDLALGLIGEGNQADLARLREKFPTSGLAVIDFQLDSWGGVAGASGRLERFETPRSVGSKSSAD